MLATGLPLIEKWTATLTVSQVASFPRLQNDFDIIKIYTKRLIQKKKIEQQFLLLFQKKLLIARDVVIHMLLFMHSHDISNILFIMRVF